MYYLSRIEFYVLRWYWNDFLVWNGFFLFWHNYYFREVHITNMCNDLQSFLNLEVTFDKVWQLWFPPQCFLQLRPAYFKLGFVGVYAQCTSTPNGVKLAAMSVPGIIFSPRPSVCVPHPFVCDRIMMYHVHYPGSHTHTCTQASSLNALLLLATQRKSFPILATHFSLF